MVRQLLFIVIQLKLFLVQDIIYMQRMLLLLFSFLLNHEEIYEPTWGNAKCPKFNIVGSEELNNLELAQIIAEAQGKELNYEMVDFHSSRPGHDLRYALDGDKMKQLGWEPAKSVRERIGEVTKWTLENERWIQL